MKRHHVTPQRSSRQDDGNAFLPDYARDGSGPRLRGSKTGNDADFFAEELLTSATTAEPVYEDASDEVVDEEEGGPFLLLDDEARLPKSTADIAADEEIDHEGHDQVHREQVLRGARWVARS